ncbi:hypothetical protein C7B65_04445 [Phormidesmis priestleyi ULC007]|uniref:DUF4145 domain-containing protein n=1 Tax=Phormidesmis priestleyi ULC007 TaxID=1920490 RepID=A0A2T1DL14_9CYAN|nr:hypothetical protein [Phormidesmis priestleyi]PSB21190.1 hypothetical protein C7B65_04445 [Phormidesmis priestleyi ULC007]PZO51283.1 MAG: hypothetical protein DCF14_09260 [Phormidesmis priestleyi]
MTEPRRRAITALDNDIGQERYKLYKSSFSWIKKSIDDGYYLEAISIVESLITDRLESYLSLLFDKDFSFKTLGELIQAIRSDKLNKTDELLRCLVLNDLDHWRKARNKAAHEMVKIEDGKRVSWEERVKINKTVAEAGLELVRKIDNQIRKLRS